MLLLIISHLHSAKLNIDLEVKTCQTQFVAQKVAPKRRSPHKLNALQRANGTSRSIKRRILWPSARLFPHYGNELTTTDCEAQNKCRLQLLIVNYNFAPPRLSLYLSLSACYNVCENAAIECFAGEK